MLSSSVNSWLRSQSLTIESHVPSYIVLDSLSEKPYICRVSQVGCKPVVGLVNLINYQNLYSRIIPHEQVNKDKVNNYIQQFILGSILNNPILLFYKKFSELQNYLSSIISSLSPINIQFINEVTYEIFSINKMDIITKLQNYLKKISKFYVADGHHRLHALSEIQAQSTVECPQLYLSFLVQEDDLNLGSFNRFIKGVNVDIETLIKKLKQKYLINQVPPEALNLETDIYMYASDRWYQLNLITQDYNDKFTLLPPVHIDKFITSEFAIQSSLTSKILYNPGTDSVDNILQFYQQNQCQIAISVPKLSSIDLFAAMEERYVLPPHSTCFTPKIPNDLFVQKINFPTTYREDIDI